MLMYSELLNSRHILSGDLMKQWITDREDKTAKVMLCMPMSGYSIPYIQAKADSYKRYIKSYFESYGVEVKEIYLNCKDDDEDLTGQLVDDSKRIDVYYMARGMMEGMCDCDICIFSPDWLVSKGCKLELFLCQLYSIPIGILERRL